MIKVETTSINTFEIESEYFPIKYYDCENGEIIVLTDDLRVVIEVIGEDIIKEIKRIGIGYFLVSEKSLGWRKVSKKEE